MQYVHCYSVYSVIEINIRRCRSNKNTEVDYKCVIKSNFLNDVQIDWLKIKKFKHLECERKNKSKNNNPSLKKKKKNKHQKKKNKNKKTKNK